MKIQLFAYVLPAVIAGVAVPMALQMIPPNGFYGFRTPKTLSSPEIWYPANRVSGWALIVSSLLAIVFNLCLRSSHPDWPQQKLILWMGDSLGSSAVLAIIASFVYLSRL